MGHAEKNSISPIFCSARICSAAWWPAWWRMSPCCNKAACECNYEMARGSLGTTLDAKYCLKYFEILAMTLQAISWAMNCHEALNVLFHAVPMWRIQLKHQDFNIPGTSGLRKCSILGCMTTEDSRLFGQCWWNSQGTERFPAAQWTVDLCLIMIRNFSSYSATKKVPVPGWKWFAICCNKTRVKLGSRGSLLVGSCTYSHRAWQAIQEIPKSKRNTEHRSACFLGSICTSGI